MTVITKLEAMRKDGFRICMQKRRSMERMFKAAVFDIGQTLVDHKMPMNWSKLYKPAFEHIAGKYNYTFSEEHYQLVTVHTRV